MMVSLFLASFWVLLAFLKSHLHGIAEKSPATCRKVAFVKAGKTAFSTKTAFSCKIASTIFVFCMAMARFLEAIASFNLSAAFPCNRNLQLVLMALQVYIHLLSSEFVAALSLRKVTRLILWWEEMKKTTETHERNWPSNLVLEC